MSQSNAISRSEFLVWNDTSIRKRAIIAGAILGALVNLSAMVVPLFTTIGGGIIAGIVAGYWIGGLRGWIHGLLAGVGAGLVGGWVVAFMGALLGMYIAPPLLVLQLAGLQSPVFSAFGGTVFLGLVVGLFIIFDGIIGGLLGAAARSGVDQVLGR
ncbi:DUF5518 domain-containing protein [Halocatena halophila]|uniref:DUF5518 domain-containing protein n=1 Tax=Halocatena halophila TaxID=2814576 RepID=UPI002ED12A3A